MKQQAVQFGDALSGVVTYPDAPRRGVPAVVFLTAGVMHKVGPNRLYVRLCRELAEHGFLTLRFDFSGIGDSLPRADSMAFSQSVLLEAQAAMDFLTATTGVERFVMAGLCSGAYAAVKTAMHDTRVEGAIVINTQTLQDADQDEFEAFAANRSIVKHLLKPSTWLKVLNGTARFEGKLDILLGQLRSVFRRGQRSESAGAITQQLAEITARGVNLLFLFSKGDPGLEYFRLLGKKRIEQLQQSARVQTEIIEGTDHIFAPPEALTRVRKVCHEWMERTYGAAAESLAQTEAGTLSQTAASALSQTAAGPAANSPALKASAVPGRHDPAQEQSLNLSFERTR